MQTHWTKEIMDEQMLLFPDGQSISAAELNRLLARIARRQARQKHRVSNREYNAEKAEEPLFDSAA